MKENFDIVRELTIDQVKNKDIDREIFLFPYHYYKAIWSGYNLKIFSDTEELISSFYIDQGIRGISNIFIMADSNNKIYEVKNKRMY